MFLKSFGVTEREVFMWCTLLTRTEGGKLELSRIQPIDKKPRLLIHELYYIVQRGIRPR